MVFIFFGYPVPGKEFNVLRPDVCSNFGLGWWEVKEGELRDDEEQQMKQQGKNEQRIKELNDAVRQKLKSYSRQH